MLTEISKLALLFSLGISGCTFDGDKDKHSDVPAEGHNGQGGQSSIDAQPNASAVVPLSGEDQTKLKEIAAILSLTEQEFKLLEDLLSRDHAAVSPLHKMVTEMDRKVAPYVKDKWLLFSEHKLELKTQKDSLEAEIASKQAEIDALKTEIDVKNEEIEALKLEVDTLKAALATKQSQYEELSIQFVNAQQQIAYLLGHTDSQGRKLEKLIISELDSATESTGAVVATNRSAALKAIARYTGSDAVRDVTHLVTWSVEQDSNEAIVEQNTMSPYIFKGIRVGTAAAKAIAKIMVAETEFRDDVNLTVANAVNVRHTLRFYSDKGKRFMGSGEKLPVGVRGRLFVNAEFRNERGQFITNSDVSDSWSFSIIAQDPDAGYSGKIRLIDQSRGLRSGLFVGLGVGKVKLRATQSSRNLDSVLEFSEPDREFSFYAGLAINPSDVRASLDYMECQIPEEIEFSLKSVNLSIPPSKRLMTFTGSEIDPGLHAFNSDCSLSELNAGAKFKLAGETSSFDTVKKQLSADGNFRFIANRPTAENQLVEAFVDDSATPPTQIPTVNEWRVKFEHQKLTQLKISTASIPNQSQCSIWRANTFDSKTPIAVDLGGRPDETYLDQVSKGAGSQLLNLSLGFPNSAAPSDQELPTKFRPLLPGDSSLNHPEAIVKHESGLKELKLDFSDLIGVVGADGQLMPGAILEDADIVVYRGIYDALSGWSFDLPESSDDNRVETTKSIVPGSTHGRADRVVISFDELKDTWIKIIVRRSAKTGIINEQVRYIGHESPGQSLTALEAHHVDNSTFIAAPFTRSQPFALAVEWNGCLTELIESGATAFNGTVSLSVEDIEGQSAEDIGSFGRRWNASRFEFDPRRARVDRQIRVKAEFDFSKLCHKADESEESPEECSTLKGSQLSDPFVVTKPRLSPRFGIEDFIEPVCNSFQQDITSVNSTIRFSKLSLELRLIPIREESYLDEELKLRCQEDDIEGLTSTIMIDGNLASVDPVSAMTHVLKPIAVQGEGILQANIRENENYTVFRRTHFSIEISDCLQNARIDPQLPNTALIRLGDYKSGDYTADIRINRQCGFRNMRIENNTSERARFLEDWQLRLLCPQMQLFMYPGQSTLCNLPYDFFLRTLVLFQTSSHEFSLRVD